MNIIMLSTDFLPNIGGIASHIFYLSQALRKIGHDVVVVNPVEKKGFSVVREEIDSLPVFRVSYPKTSNMFLRVWRRTRITLKVLHQIATPLMPIVLHQHDHLNSTMASFFFRQSCQTRWIWTNHTSTFLLDMENPFKHMLFKLLYGRVDAVVGVSKSRLDKALSLFTTSKYGEFIANGIDITRFNCRVASDRSKYGMSSTDFVILCPSRMMPVKGVIYFAEAAKFLIARYPQIPWHFVFLGNEVKGQDATDKKYIEEIMQLLLPVHARGLVSYLGNVPPENMPGIYAVADVVVLPSLMEGAPLSVLEAMATRKTVIASNIEGLMEVIKDHETGLLVPPKDPSQLARSLYTLYDDKQLREQLASNAERLAYQYSWQHIARQTSEFYQRVWG